MPTFPRRRAPAYDPRAAQRWHPWTRLARLSAVLFVVTGLAMAAAQTCTTSWPEFRIVDVDGSTSTPWADPTSIDHHSQLHLSRFNARLAAANYPFEYQNAFVQVLRSTFGYEYAYIADQMGLKDLDDVWMAIGLSGLNDFVNFDDPIEVGYDDTGTYCANLYSITDGSHEGELLLIVRDPKTDRIKHWEVVPNEDIGRARAHQVMKELASVMLDPDGCGDMRVGEGC